MQIDANTLGEVNQGGSTRIGRPATNEREGKNHMQECGGVAIDNSSETSRLH